MQDYCIMGTQINRPGLFVPLLLLIVLGGCQSPFLVFPGKALQGGLQQTNSFAFAEQFKVLQLETRPAAPYSVYLRVTVIEGELYIDASPGRRWAKYLRETPNCRIKLGDSLYNAVAEEVLDPAVIQLFMPARRVYRIVPVLAAANEDLSGTTRRVVSGYNAALN